MSGGSKVDDGAMRSEPERTALSRAQWLKRLARRRRDRIAFVFSGGGPLGALQVGALKALVERAVLPELVVGTSVGALNAAFLAFAPTQRGVADLEEIWRGMKDEDLFPGGRFGATWARFLVRGNRVFENSGMRHLVETRLGSATFEDAEIPLGVVATDLDTGAEKVFTTGPLLEPLLASTAMPGIYPPVVIDGRSFIDGGVANNVPIVPAISLGAKTVYVLDSTAHANQKRPLLRPMDYLLHAFSLARAQRLALERLTLEKERVRIVMLPTVPLDFYVPFASFAHTQKLIELSYTHTKEYLAGERAEVVTELAGGTVEAIAPAE